jgi:hypothetical protein
MLTLPADVARCKGRAWPEDTFLAPECQACERWVAHYCWGPSDGPVTHTEPPTEQECPIRLPIDDSTPATAELALDAHISKCLDTCLDAFARYRKHCDVGRHAFAAMREAARAASIDPADLVAEKLRSLRDARGLLRFTDPHWWTLRRLRREWSRPNACP